MVSVLKRSGIVLVIALATVVTLLQPGSASSVSTVSQGDQAVAPAFSPETLFLDTREAADDGAAGPVTSSQGLTAGEPYLVTVDGTFSAWSTIVAACGEPEPSPETPSSDPAAQNGQVNHDAEIRFAAPAAHASCSSLPAHIAQLEMDIGAGFAHVEPVDGAASAPAPGHLYYYVVGGEGSQISFRWIDQPTSDNYGVFTITVSEACTVDTQLDIDCDGVPDTYEDGQACLDKFALDSSFDPDADGLSSLTEFQIGTDPCVADTDRDGCRDGREVKLTDPALGGSRDPLSFWDMMSVFTGNPLVRDATVSVADISAVAGRFGSNDTGSGTFDRGSDPLSTPNKVIGDGREDYHPSYDRGGSDPAGNVWNLLPPDGAISVGDIMAAVAQFGHSCA